MSKFNDKVFFSKEDYKTDTLWQDICIKAGIEPKKEKYIGKDKASNINWDNPNVSHFYSYTKQETTYKEVYPPLNADNILKIENKILECYTETLHIKGLKFGIYEYRHGLDIIQGDSRLLALLGFLYINPDIYPDLKNIEWNWIFPSGAAK